MHSIDIENVYRDTVIVMFVHVCVSCPEICGYGANFFLRPLPFSEVVKIYGGLGLQATCQKQGVLPPAVLNCYSFLT